MIAHWDGDTKRTSIGKERDGMSMEKYICDVCGWIYDPEVGDPENGIAPGTPFEELPDSWACPLCHQGKDVFSKA